MVPQAAPEGAVPHRGVPEARPSTAPSRGRRWGMLQGSPQLGLLPKVPLPDGYLSKTGAPLARPAAAWKPVIPRGPRTDEKGASTSSSHTPGGSRLVDATPGAAEDEKREQGPFEKSQPEVINGLPTDRGASAAAWERYLVARRPVFAAPDPALPSALGGVRAKRGVFGASETLSQTQDSATRQGSSGPNSGDSCNATRQGSSGPSAGDSAPLSAQDPQGTRAQGSGQAHKSEGTPDVSTANGSDKRSVGCEAGPGPEKPRPREAPWGPRPSTAPSPGAGPERRISALVRAWEARSQGLATHSLRGSLSRPTETPQAGEDPGKGASETRPEDPEAFKAPSATRLPPKECAEAVAAPAADSSPRPRHLAVEKMAYLGRSQRPYVARLPAADRRHVGRGREFPGAGMGLASGNIQRKLAKSYATDIKGPRPRAHPTGASSGTEGTTPGSSEGNGSGSTSSIGSGEPPQGVACEERQVPGQPTDGLSDRVARAGEAEDRRLLPALKHLPWALREEPSTPAAILRWPLGGQGSAGSEAREAAATGSKQAPGSAFPALKHMSWSLDEKEGADDLASLLRKRLTDWTKSAQQAAWPGAAAGNAQREAPEQGSAELGPSDDPAAALCFKGSPDSTGAPEGTLVCVCESEDCSHTHTSSEGEEDEQGERAEEGQAGRERGGEEEAEEEEEVVFHDCRDSDGVTECSESSSESPLGRSGGQDPTPDLVVLEVPSTSAVPEAPAPAEGSAEQPLSPLNAGEAGKGQKLQAGAWLAGFLAGQHHRAHPVPRSRTADGGMSCQLPVSAQPGNPRSGSRCSASLVPRSRTADSGQGPEVQQQQPQQQLLLLPRHAISADLGGRGLGVAWNAQGGQLLPSAESLGREREDATGMAPGAALAGLGTHQVRKPRSVPQGGLMPQEGLQLYSALDTVLPRGDLECPLATAEAAADGESENRAAEGESESTAAPEGVGLCKESEWALAAGGGAESAAWTRRDSLNYGLGQAPQDIEEGLGHVHPHRNQSSVEGSAEEEAEDGGDRGDVGERLDASLGPMAEPERPFPATLQDGGDDTKLLGLGDTAADAQVEGPTESPVEAPAASTDEGLPGHAETPSEALAEGSTEGLLLLLGPFWDEGTVGAGTLAGRRRKLEALQAELEDLLRDSGSALELELTRQQEICTLAHPGKHPLWAVGPGAGKHSPGKAGANKVATRRCEKEGYLAVLFRGERVCTFQDGMENWEAPAAGYKHQILMESAVAAVSEFYFSCCAY